VWYGLIARDSVLASNSLSVSVGAKLVNKHFGKDNLGF